MSNSSELGATGYTSGLGHEFSDSIPFSDSNIGDSGSGSGSYQSLSVLPDVEPKLVKSDPKYYCPVHHGLLRDAVQTPCGHRLCLACVQLYLGDDVLKMCPARDDDCEEISKDNILPDPGFRREIKQLLVFCSNANDGKGCPERLKFSELEKHVSTCPFREVRCIYLSRGCETKMLAKNLQEHEDICQYRPVSCDLCNMDFNAYLQKKHEEEVCPEALLECPYKCGQSQIKRRLLEDHKVACPKKPTECVFKSLGCTYVGDAADVRLHEDNKSLHFDVVCQFALLSEVQRKEERRRFQELSELVGEVQQILERTENNIKTIHRDLKLKMVQQVERLIIVEQKVDQLPASQGSSTQEIQQLQQSIEQLKGLIPQVASHDRQVASHEIRMAEMDLRFQMLETASYDGKLLWKIRDFSHRKRDAVQGRTVSLYSQPFYTGRFGYKMCARVYLNGDGIGRGTHMSLYFVVMKGEYDALLSWPFQQRVSLILLDQSPEKRHLKDEFFPDPNSTSFRRPMNAEMNVASGCPLFVAHTVLENQSNNYIKDDTLFIKVMVETSNLQLI